MSGEVDDDAIECEAARWAVRCHASDFDLEGMEALAQWLEVSPRHGSAFDRATDLWEQLDRLQGGARVIPLTTRRVEISRRSPLRRWLVGGAMAACLAGALAVSIGVLIQTPETIYETQKGEQRAVALADGTILSLNTATRVSVRLSDHRRKLVLEHGEVALKVAHDSRRPLELSVGSTRITDLGTEFDVRRDEDTVSVAVREGLVRMADTELQAGQVGIQKTGDGTVTVTRATAEEAFAWQSHHAIYRDQPLSVVARDLNRYFETPLVVDADSGSLRLTAVLTLDSESAVVGRLQEFLPVRARTTQTGIYLTRAVEPLRP